MKFAIWVTIALVFFGLTIIPPISESFALNRWNPSDSPTKNTPKPPLATKPNPFKTSQKPSKVLVKWGYSYPCPIIFCDSYVEGDFKEIPSSGTYTKTGIINGKYEWVRPFYILVSDSPGQYSGTRLLRVAEFGKGLIYEKTSTWIFDEGKAGNFERANFKERILLDKEKLQKTTITMSFTRIK